MNAMASLKALRWPDLVIATVLVAALGIVAWRIGVRHDDEQADGRRADAVQVATAEVTDLTTMDPSTADNQMKQLGSRLTGDFKKQFAGFASAFADGVAQGKVSTTGTIDGAAISAFSDKAATVLVASSAEVGTTGAQKTIRHWRFAVDLVRQNDAWLITGMEFVQ